MIDQLSVRIYALGNRVPTAVLALELFGAAVALGLLGLYLALLGRGWLPMLLAVALVTMLLLVIFELDRPIRGLISIPSTPYQSLLAFMRQPPAAHLHPIHCFSTAGQRRFTSRLPHGA
jgi:hypothetical protein